MSAKLQHPLISRFAEEIDCAREWADFNQVSGTYELACTLIHASISRQGGGIPTPLLTVYSFIIGMFF